MNERSGQGWLVGRLGGLWRRLRRKRLPPVRTMGELPPAEHPLLTPYLEGIIRAREAGDSELSLRLIEAARSMGMHSPWLADNEARALVLLDRRQEALDLWRELEGCSDQAVAAVAGPMAVLQAEAIAFQERQREQERLEELRRRGEEIQRRRSERVAPLQEICMADQWDPHHLKDVSTDVDGDVATYLPTDPEESGDGAFEAALEKAVLEEVIAIREAGRPELSLHLIQAAHRLGIDSPWLADNEARALVLLDRRQEALDLWQRLETCQDDAVATVAQQMAPLQAEAITRQQRQREQERLDRLREICTAAHWVPHHLDGVPSDLRMDTSENGGGGSDTALENAVLEEVIAIREAGRAELSIDVIEAARQLGVDSPWLSDNQARALVLLDRRPEALALWCALVDHPSSSLAGMAREMANRQTQELWRESTIQEAESAIAAGEANAAIQLLGDAMVIDPEWAPFRERLQQALELRDLGSADSGEPVLKEHRVQLSLFETFLDGLEKRMQQPGER